MFTVVETQLFQKQWPLYWTEEERGASAAFLAEHPNAGDVVPDSGDIVLLTLYAKSKTDNLTGSTLKEIRRALER